MSGHGEKLSRCQESLIAALLTCGTIREAAAQAKVSTATARRWMKAETFQTEYRRAKAELVSTATTNLRGEMSKGVRVLATIAGSKKAPPASRVSSAVALIKLGLEAHQLENLEQRIAQLEREMEREK